MDTCSNPEHAQLCEDHCVAGCFCPEGEQAPLPDARITQVHHGCRTEPEAALGPWVRGGQARGGRGATPLPTPSQRIVRHLPHGLPASAGMVLDDVGHTGCIPVSGCSCMYNGATYAPGTGYSTDCTNW